MRKLSRILALLATIMLVIGGAPAVASTQACDPCPADCPMMQALAEEAGQSPQAPEKGGKADNPCQQMIACQVAAATVTPSEVVTIVLLTATPVAHEAFDPLRALSRPPDRSLRPPIHI